jgi:hypothetical protein
VQPGKPQALESFVQAITESRWADYEDFQGRSQVRKVAWFLQSSPHGNQFLIYNEGDDFTKLVGDFAASTHPFDVWFEEQLRDITGLDVRTFDPSRLPKLLLTYGY